ncbi:MAG: YqeG family HAD IIIA-type phosphatase [Bacteroidaceae bacterium]|nr:YqeG family HAD IIIA-type phosphatase [Bacteroidaceae bacterium]
MNAIMKNVPELIVMLTYDDFTVKNASEIFEECKDSKAKFWGFKEHPLSHEEMKGLYARMKECGKTTFLEVVAYTEEEGLEGAKAAIDCGCDVLMGTTYFDSINALCKQHGLKYMPFVGKVEGRPSVLSGEINDMVAEAKRYLEKGVYGIDLLGYRYEGDAVALNKVFRKSINAPVCIAGSIDSYTKLDEIKDVAPWAFTVGSAFFDHKFGGDFAKQVDAVCDYMNSSVAVQPSGLSRYFPYEYVNDVFSIPYWALYKKGIRGLIFDIDNTLVPHGKECTEEVVSLFEKLHKIGFTTLLLSNNSVQRVEKFNLNIGAHYIADANKPHVESFKKALALLKMNKQEVVVIGDHVLTDVRGANDCGLASILVKYIGHEKWGWKGWSRYLERLILSLYSCNKKYRYRLLGKCIMKKKKLFCEINATTYAISLQKEMLKRHLKNMLGKEKYATERSQEKLPVLVASYGGDMIKRGPGIDEQLQINKAENIRLACSRMNGLVIHPGESFSFWHYVGKTSKKNGFTEGRVIVNGKLVSGVGGGLCNLANTLNQLVMDSPLTVTEIHHHSDALAPDPNGVRVPYSAGTSVNYNFVDYRFRNDTEQPVQLCTWCEGDILCTELRTTKDFPFSYRIVEENHHFHQEDNGKFYRKSKIYREIIDKTTGDVVKRELKWNNRSEVMFDYFLIPTEQIK